MSYSAVSYLYVSFSRLITSNGEERANCSITVYLYLNYVVSVRRVFDLDRLRY